MKEIPVRELTQVVKELCMESNYNLREDVLLALKDSLEIESSKIGRAIIEQIIKNAEIARLEELPICQDCGVVNVLLEIGQDVFFVGGSIKEAVNEGVRKGYSEGFLRKSMVDDPCFDRKNTGDNSPAMILMSMVPGDSVKVIVMPKGGGSENVGVIKMLLPGDGPKGVKKTVLEAVKNANASSCPPIVVGVGIGGTFDSVGLLAKKALLRNINERNKDERYANLEISLLEEINNLGIGPGGLGGKVTALSVNIETRPCHMACLPVAVNFGCCALRSAEKVL
ncbi:fumarate hydratase [Candidatus Oleimmundimicrobium sp.]|uniref:fumarate hydratase n=1 Tax=Candidatus Oleimmundimicrobium sp. TaxID=3060597 RepID=UPI0027286770|nr:fumarate hydratase [Candidatus Oleimmundimicrobium sp.]MDO8886426.1 fumarate hydratase [Candidatus Oleimmundimicrobium sp.]